MTCPRSHSKYGGSEIQTGAVLSPTKHSRGHAAHSPLGLSTGGQGRSPRYPIQRHQSIPIFFLNSYDNCLRLLRSFSRPQHCHLWLFPDHSHPLPSHTFLPRAWPRVITSIGAGSPRGTGWRGITRMGVTRLLSGTCVTLEAGVPASEMDPECPTTSTPPAVTVQGPFHGRSVTLLPI